MVAEGPAAPGVVRGGGTGDAYAESDGSRDGDSAEMPSTPPYSSEVCPHDLGGGTCTPLQLWSPRRRSTCSGWIGSALTQRACSLGTRTLECFDCMFEGMCNLLFPGYPRLEPKFWSLARAARKIFFAAAQYICTAFILSVPWSPWPFIWFWDPKSVPSFELLLHEPVLHAPRTRVSLGSVGQRTDL